MLRVGCPGQVQCQCAYKKVHYNEQMRIGVYLACPPWGLSSFFWRISDSVPRFGSLGQVPGGYNTAAFQRK